ncbi:hypothetical protein [uncultured Methylobacterium sp.]|jgi:hypothetical protein|uniref:hypothetical protein n=1 Tax=uncultured Methylobacterium sp. TaxID=157278 RepID=UPI002614D4C1|nr:hypothetical protein [uncultured Methylobacterium sp.]
MTRIGTPDRGVPDAARAEPAGREAARTPGRSRDSHCDSLRDPAGDPFRNPERGGDPRRQPGFGQPGFGQSGFLHEGRGDLRGAGERGPGFGDGPWHEGQDRDGVAFRARVEERTRDGGGEGAAGDRDRLLAELAPAVLPLAPAMPVPAMPVPAMPTVPATGAADPVPDPAARRVEVLAERIAEAVRLDRIAEVQGGSFRLVGDGTGGLDAITVRLTGDSLDVTLAHAFDASGEALAGAARLLAERLRERFPARRIRVLEAAGSAPDGLAALGRLFGSGPA